jgi:hypothetical protein
MIEIDGTENKAALGPPPVTQEDRLLRSLETL